MKKQNSSKILLERLAKRRHSLRLRRKRKKYDRFQTLRAIELEYDRIKAPSKLCVYSIDKENDDTFSSTLKFIEEVENGIISSEKLVIDFLDTSRIEAAALVLMYSRFDLALRRRHLTSKLKVVNSANSPLVRKILRRSNLLKLLRGSHISYEFLRDAEHPPIVVGRGDQWTDELIDYIKYRCFDDTLTGDQEFVIADAIKETVNNVDFHAYPSIDKNDREWWLLCQVIDKVLYLAIYDAGVGIPATITRQNRIFSNRLKSLYPTVYESVKRDVLEKSDTKWYQRLLKQISDAQAIAVAMHPNASSTEKQKHGQGSISIHKLVEETKEGVLYIYSNRGCLKKRSAYPQKEITLEKSISGTLIQWNFRIR